MPVRRAAQRLTVQLPALPARAYLAATGGPRQAWLDRNGQRAERAVGRVGVNAAIAAGVIVGALLILPAAVLEYLAPVGIGMALGCGAHETGQGLRRISAGDYWGAEDLADGTLGLTAGTWGLVSGCPLRKPGYKTPYARAMGTSPLDSELGIEGGRLRVRDPVRSPGKISDNPANRLIETGEPLKRGGWRTRWYGMTPADEIEYQSAVAARYNELLKATRWMPNDGARQVRRQAMSTFRKDWLRSFLANRQY